MTGPARPATPVVVIAVGNRFRGDDGVAGAVLDALAGRLPPGVTSQEVDGEPSRLLDAWADAGAVIVVDAARSGRTPGTAHRIVALPAGSAAPVGPSLRDGWSPGASSHGGGLAEAMALGRALDRLPAALTVIAVEGAAFAPSDQLSPAVAEAVPAAADAVLVEALRLRRRGAATTVIA